MDGFSADWPFGQASMLHPLTLEEEQLLGSFQHTHVNLGLLEKKERSMGQAAGKFSSFQLFKEIERAANAPDATESNQADLKTLIDLRQARNIAGSFQHYYRQGHVLESTILPRVEGLTQPCLPDGSCFWAVIVGINEYQHLPPLSGACSDAKAVYDYLTVELSVPQSHIRLLLSEISPTSKDPLFPTRENLLSTLFDHLRDNPHVRRGDNIIFYYAGYGTNYPVGRTFQRSGDIEALCPADRDDSTPHGRILDISDREISLFLEELRDAKGDNVTVILDCCYDGEPTPENALRKARFAKPMAVSWMDILCTADKDARRKPGSRSVFSEHWAWDSSACVLLTACRSSESALENKFSEGWHGFFTRALLALLRQGKCWTYIELCNAVKEYMPRYRSTYVQTPLVAGNRRDCRICFSLSICNLNVSLCNLPLIRIVACRVVAYTPTSTGRWSMTEMTEKAIGLLLTALSTGLQALCLARSANEADLVAHKHVYSACANSAGEKQVVPTTSVRVFVAEQPEAMDSAEGPHARFNKLNKRRKKLEIDRSKIHKLYCPNRDPDSTDLVKIVEKKAESPDATQEDEDHLNTLYALKAVYAEISEISLHISQKECESVTIPTGKSQDTVSKPPVIDGARFWAVVVGIDAYERFTTALSGACSDAKAVYEYLIGDLQVPPSHVSLFLSESGSTAPSSPTTYSSAPATRDNILSALFNLRDNINVKHGDNILFYYSGHGVSYSPAGTLDQSSPIEALCPADRGSWTNGKLVLDISDREISIFLEELYNAKGNHVTVILDCCYSGGATRCAPAEPVKAATPMHVTLEQLLSAADDDKRRQPGSRHAFSKTQQWTWDITTCVLLSACTSYEYAREAQLVGDKWHGHFTHVLLASLRANSNRTYTEICAEVGTYMPRYGDIPIQTPQVVGTGKHSKLWYAQEPQVFTSNNREQDKEGVPANTDAERTAITTVRDDGDDHNPDRSSWCYIF
ncbi:hypothetical protein NM688_g2265 [Phlebia brevispora]|uniref:Uncharacterized protein n=1 Tax=Phlebia brevispora TaxID=194682 RepID=A0ACC1T9D4_9APHY|nr:hypothetical protein NM688_g2265 [Phlebia brevispora]